MESSPSDMFLLGGNLRSQFTPEQRRHSFDNNTTTNNNNKEHFVVEDLLDFPKEVDPVVVSDAPIFDHHFTTATAGSSTDSSTFTVVDSCNSSVSGSGADLLHMAVDVGYRSFSDGHLSSDLCVPYDDLAELEWLSNFVEESFSSEDLQKLQLISGMKARTDEASETTTALQPQPNSTSPVFQPDMSVAPKAARSKRSRAAPGNWASCLLVLSPNANSSSSNNTTTTEMDPGAPPNTTCKKTIRAQPKKKQGPEVMGGAGGVVRKCLHCATDKTPQWRTGPMGPKTLCNACGVRYKSGRLVPEYRPAASPTFVLTKHSNSHRKVLELRRQKEMLSAEAQQLQQQQLLHHGQNMILDVTNGDDYLIHQHVGPDFRQLT